MKIDKNTAIGLALMGLMMFGFLWYNMRVGEAQRKAEQAKADSLALVEANAPKPPVVPEMIQPTAQASSRDTMTVARQSQINQDKFGILSPASQGSAQDVLLSNGKIKVTLNTKGGMVKNVELTDGQKRYGTDRNIQLWIDSLSRTKVQFNLSGKGSLGSDYFFFAPSAMQVDASQSAQQLVMKMPSSDPSKYIEFVYSLSPDSYKVDFRINVVGLGDELELASKPINLEWYAVGYANEKGISAERSKSSVFYREMEEDRDYLSESGDRNELVEKKLNWMAFKQDYFSAIVISKDGFKEGAQLAVMVPQDSISNKSFYANLGVQMPGGSNSFIDLSYYFGPNDYKELKSLEVEQLDKVIDYGWGIIGWVNKYCVRPLFWFFSSWIGSFGLIILIVTIIIKTILFPVTWKNFLSSAKMRVLKPEIDEINKKFEGKADAAVEKQQATMALYRQTGVNPFAGCIPVLFQMPILYAMFRFFPAEIVLRGKSFLWADDLAAYDSIFSWTQQIPVLSSVYGNHVSGFTILMCISTFVYSKMSMQNTPAPTQPGMPDMKLMMNLFTFMMLFFFNNQPSGLSIYYFSANMISIGQMWAIKKYFIDEGAIRAKIDSNKKKVKTKSGFMQRLEEAQKLQKQKLAQQAKKK
jgi:YidC/Oxa1 family membrane protein insertase